MDTVDDGQQWECPKFRHLSACQLNTNDNRQVYTPTHPPTYSVGLRRTRSDCSPHCWGERSPSYPVGVTRFSPFWLPTLRHKLRLLSSEAPSGQVSHHFITSFLFVFICLFYFIEANKPSKFVFFCLPMSSFGAQHCVCSNISILMQGEMEQICPVCHVNLSL